MSRRRQAGFTLIELLVALSLLALISGVVAGGLAFVAKAWDRGEAAAEANNTMARVHELLRRQIGRTFRLAWGEVDELSYAFEGDDKRLRFAVVEPPYPAQPGLYLLSLEEVEHPEGAQLRYTRTPYLTGMTAFDEIEPSEDIGLVHGRLDFAFGYYRAATDRREGEWLDRWTETTELPKLIRLRVTEAARETLYWPDLVVRLDIDVDTACLAPLEGGLCTLVEN